MKKSKLLSALLISLFAIGIVFTACEKDEEFEELFIYISTELYDGTLELSYGGDNLDPHPDYSVGNVFVYTIKPIDASVELGFSFYFKGTHYSSSTSGNLILQASETESISYTLYPTGNTSEPLEIDDISDPSNANPVIGNWEKSTGGAFLKFTSSNIYLCNSNTLIEYSGTFYPSENRAVITEGETIITFYAYTDETDRILIKQYVSDQHVEDIYYYKTTEYPCN